jgi:hypothetical protein
MGCLPACRRNGRISRKSPLLKLLSYQVLRKVNLARFVFLTPFVFRDSGNLKKRLPTDGEQPGIKRSRRGRVPFIVLQIRSDLRVQACSAC